MINTVGWNKYYAITCNFLPGTCKYFDTKKEVIDHIKKMTDEAAPWVTDEQIHMSYRVYKMDSRWFDGKDNERLIRKIFPEHEKTPITSDYTKEYMRPDLITEEESTQEPQANT